MQKKTIINADDFGISYGTNKGVEKAHRNGILTSVSIMPTGVAFLDAVKIAKRNKKLGVGIHLSLTWGKSILSYHKIPDLVDSRNYFYPSFFSLFLKVYKNKKILQQIEDELAAQINAVVKVGIKPDHLNGQIHIHFIPRIFPIVLRLAKKNNVRFVRAPVEPLFVIPQPASFSIWFLLLVFSLILKLQGKLPKDIVGFYGVLRTSAMTEKIIQKILMRKENRIVEILSHPGEFNLGNTSFDFAHQGVSSFIKSPNRLLELSALIDPKLKQFIKENDIELINFSEISL